MTITVGTVIGRDWYYDIAPLALKQIEGFADELIIINSGYGATETIHRCLDGLEIENIKVSSDSTSFSDGTPNLAHCKNTALGAATSDYYMYLDCDEVFMKEDLEEIKMVLPPYDFVNPMFIRVAFYNFFGDFYHVHEGLGNTHVPRVYTRSKGMLVRYDEEFVRQNGDHEIWDVQSRLVSGYQNHLDLRGIRIFHYGWALGKEHTLKKYKFLQSWHGKEFNTPTKIVFPLSLQPGIIPYNGEHPKIMKQHPLWGWHEPTEKEVVDIALDG